MLLAIPTNSQSLPIEIKGENSKTHQSRFLHLLTDCTDLSKLKQIHAQAIRNFSTHNSSLFLYSRILHVSSLIDFDYACRVFNQIDNPNSFMWNTLIGACARSLDRKEQAIEIFYRMLEEARQWNDVGIIRKVMTDMGVTKEPGCSSIEIDGISHEFFAGDTSHPRIKEIYGVIDLIEEKLERRGYSPDCSQATMHMEGGTFPKSISTMLPKP
ncbi:hypothetical protein Csa_008805 [Cucumis sativus]|nr:hypothetical protein Csa_008805 [Cucumis sativus]